MKILNGSLLCTLFVATIASVHADTLLGQSNPNVFTYNYAELSYINVDDVDVEGFSLRGSKNIEPNLSLIGSLQSADSENVDLTIFSVGAAYHRQLEEKDIIDTDFIIHLEVENVDISAKHGNVKNNDENGLLFGAGLRVKVVPEAELFGDLSIRTAGDTDLIATIGGRYSFNTNLQGCTSIELNGENTLSLGIRYYP